MRCYHFFIFEVIVESVNLITDIKIYRKLLSPWWRTINFLKNLYQNAEQKERCACNRYSIARNDKNSNLFDKQLLFYKKVDIKTSEQKKDVLASFILLQETKNSNLLDKIAFKRGSNAIFITKKVDLDKSLLNR